MKNEKLQKLDQDIEEVLDDPASDLAGEIVEKKRDRDRKLLASEIAKQIFPLIEKSKTDTIEIIKKVKFEPKVFVDAPKVPEPKVIVRDAKAPKVTVRPPQVNVKVEGQEEMKKSTGFLKKIFETFEKILPVKITGISKKEPLPVTLIYDGQTYRAMGGGGFPSFKKDTDGYLQVSVGDAYRISDKDDDASPNYYGFVNKGGAWYILKETVSAGADTYRYVKGSADYTTNWTNRASLTYDYYHNVF